ncbi:uncharacterized protein MELLADRAFT_107841 [Melampsora larici-populina 98AG31]|uniref:DUF7143 domain-containing protein n=1 Tax=Melampsora larici-populina (strain 98AG31 / pathotype 3-4-7) TaxID=747676 RepID=F4RR39_MELLP|nr:uncharacterized protein MELLADRAFT_107841 [Melampsora larici-populina 98AG31]EGG05146.1 hypothetical protein MELLADRAFT_107841 [Melampsora larici-populina 98AG31]
MYFQSNQIWSILLLTSILGLALEAKSVPKPSSQDNTGVCFLVGQSSLPSDVVVNKELAKSCIAGSSAFPDEKTLKKLPDILFKSVKFSDISYKKRKSGASAVRFAIDTFGKKSKAELETALQVYGAINAGLRSIGDGAAKKVLGELKG